LQVRAADTPLVERKWQIEDAERKALLAIPESAHTTASPLVFVFHCHRGSMQNAVRSLGIHRIWPEAIVVYMQGEVDSSPEPRRALRSKEKRTSVPDDPDGPL
jgi:poly(3-hydroxybutyrate) depolymerase